jgi:hypothetical protein
MISAGKWDFTTVLPLPPLSLTQGIDMGPWTDMSEGYPQQINIVRSGPREAAALGVWHEET